MNCNKLAAFVAAIWIALFLLFCWLASPCRGAPAPFRKPARPTIVGKWEVSWGGIGYTLQLTADGKQCTRVTCTGDLQSRGTYTYNATYRELHVIEEMPNAMNWQWSIVLDKNMGGTVEYCRLDECHRYTFKFSMRRLE